MPLPLIPLGIAGAAGLAKLLAGVGGSYGAVKLYNSYDNTKPPNHPDNLNSWHPLANAHKTNKFLANLLGAEKESKRRLDDWSSEGTPEGYDDLSPEEKMEWINLQKIGGNARSKKFNSTIAEGGHGFSNAKIDYDFDDEILDYQDQLNPDAKLPYQGGGQFLESIPKIFPAHGKVNKGILNAMDATKYGLATAAGTLGSLATTGSVSENLGKSGEAGLEGLGLTYGGGWGMDDGGLSKYISREMGLPETSIPLPKMKNPDIIGKYGKPRFLDETNTYQEELNDPVLNEINRQYDAGPQEWADKTKDLSHLAYEGSGAAADFAIGSKGYLVNLPKYSRQIRNLKKTGKVLEGFGATRKNVKIPRKKGVKRRILQKTGYVSPDEGIDALAKGKPRPTNKRRRRGRRRRN